MHLLHDYLCQQLDDALEKRSVVVFYDPRREFQPFFDRELPEAGKGYGDLPRVFIGERLTFVVRYTGSFFGVRAAVEPIAALEKPERLIIYVPGVGRDRHASVLMEMEKGGVCYEPHLRRLALNVLRKKFTDGQIDQILRPSVTWDDIVAFIAQADTGTRASVLRVLFGGTQSESLIAQWLADDSKDAEIESKEAVAEMLKLIDVRLGLALPEATTLPAARDRTLRYVLVGEFRSDLSCDPPASVSMIPAPPTKEHVDRLREVAATVRQKYAAQYVNLADRVSSELGLEGAGIDARHLGNIDTFRFEERRLLAQAGGLIATKRYDEAAGVVADRTRSFWLDRDIGRQAQWEVCRRAPAAAGGLGRQDGRRAGNREGPFGHPSGA
jgi:hypothetical protein